MNRATKRLLAKQEAAAEKARAGGPGTPGGTGRGGYGGGNGGGRGPLGGGKRRAPEGGEREGRVKRFRRFLKEVRQELKKVAWPTRGEVFVYTVVVLISVTFVTLLVFVLDFGFAKGILQFFKTT